MLWPKCSAEMTEGFIDNAKCPLYRKPQGYEEDIFSFHSGKHVSKLQLGDGGYLLGGCVTAIYCSACDLMGESPRDGTTTGAVGPWRIPAVIAPQKSVMVL